MSSVDQLSKLQISSLDDLPEIRPFPEIASQIMAACEDPQTSADKLCDLVQCDAAVSLRVMSVANSSAYGLSGGVKTLNHAVVVLGFRSLKNLVVSVAAGDVFRGSGEAAVYYDELWNQSVACAAVASRLAKATKLVPADEAFLAGIVHDVGKLVFLDLAPEEYHRAMSNTTVENIVEHENELLGTDHQELGLQCSDQWGLPMEIGDAVSAHHDAFRANDNSELVNLTGLSERLERIWGIGSVANDGDTLEAALENCVLTMDAELIKSLEDVIREDFAALKNSFTG